MGRALELAERGPAHGPNPRVGCVILGPARGSDPHAAPSVLGEGWHRGAGTPHAEPAALEAARAAGLDPRGATAVVTLEPCDHTGRRPPCTEALLAAGIARVVVAGRDPNPVAAGGVDRLRAAGVEVETGVLEEEAAQLNRRWLFAVTAGRPFVTWKFAATLDGRSAAADGTSAWITSPAAREDVHRLRAGADALVVGTGTALADDPRLTVRQAPGDPGAPTRPPLRVVVGRRPLPPGARLRDDAAPTLHLTSHDPGEVLAELYAREVRHVWLEGGPTLAAAFWRAGLVDEVVAYLAPALLGAGPAAVADLGVTTMAGIARLTTRDVALIGGDVRVVAVPAPADPAPPDTSPVPSARAGRHVVREGI